MKKIKIWIVLLIAILMAISMVSVEGVIVFGPVIMPPSGAGSVSLVIHPVINVTPTHGTTTNSTVSGSCKPGEPCYQKNSVGVKYWGFSVPPPQVLNGGFIFLPGMPNIPMISDISGGGCC